MSEIIRALTEMPKLHDLPISGIHMITALRLTAVARQTGDDPMQFLPVRFRSVNAAKAFVALAQRMCAAWPEPFTLSRPCCCRMTHDEALAASMLITAQSGELRRFSGLCGELIAAKHHDSIYHGMLRFAGELNASVKTRV